MSSITVYSTALSAPCEQMKAWLTHHEYPFIVRDVMMDEEAGEVLESRNIRSTVGRPGADCALRPHPWLGGIAKARTIGLVAFPPTSSYPPRSPPTPSGQNSTRCGFQTMCVCHSKQRVPTQQT